MLSIQRFEGPRLATVLQIIPSLNAGGAERTTIEVAEAVTARGGRALVASAGGAMEDELERAGGQLIRMRFAKNPVSIVANARALRRIVADEGVDIVHARSRVPAWCTVLARPKSRFAFVTTYHGAHSGRSALKRAYNGVMARGDIVIANSNYMKDRIVEAHGTDPARIRVIPRGVDLTRFDPARVTPDTIARTRADFGAGAGDALILLPARLTFWKGHAIALRALAALADIPARLVFAGDGGEEEKLRDLARTLGVESRVTFAGHVSDMPAAYAAADIVIAPSTLPEAFGRTAAEAQAMGVPAIAAAHGGALEVVEDGVTGRLVPPGDADALAQAIRAVLAMPEPARRALGAAGRARIASLYTAQALQDATMAVYEEVMGAR